MHTDTLSARAPEVIAPGSGVHHHFLNHLATVKIRGSEESAMSVVQFGMPRGFGPPLHVHRDEEELFLVEEGELVFLTGDDRIEAPAGTVALLPSGVAHTFQVVSDTARITNVTASRTGVPVFDRMVADLGVVSPEPTMPDPTEIDPGRVAEVCAAYGIDIVGPPPPPLD